MNIHLIAINYTDVTKKNINAFRLFDSDSGQVRDQTYNAVYNVLKDNKLNIHGIKLDRSDDKLKGSNGSFDRYPSFCGNKMLNNSLIVIASLDDKGYIVSNFKGMTTSATCSEVIAFADKIGIANGKIVTKDNKRFISAINGNYDNRPATSDTRLSKKISEAKYANEIKKSITKQGRDYRFAPVVTGMQNPNSMLKEMDEVSGMTIEQKMLYTMLALKHVRPFYYSIFNTLKRVETPINDNIDTMAVSLDTLYFNPLFIKEKPLPELLFIYIHEICHIGMKHRVREKGREHDIWNQACDYYINKHIAEEFDLHEPGDEVYARPKINTEAPAQYKIALPTDCLYNKNVSINSDTPESIYEELMKLTNDDSNDNQQPGNSNQSQQGCEHSSGGNSDNSSGNQSQQQNSDESGKNNTIQQSGNNGTQNDKDNNAGDSKSDLEKLADGEDVNKQNTDNNEGSTKTKKSDNKNSNGNTQGNEGNAQEGNEGKPEKQPGRLVGKEFRGEKIPDYKVDIVDDQNSRGMSSEQMAQKAQSILNRAVTIHRQSHQFGGDTADFLERMVEMALAPKIDWRTLLKNLLTLASQKVNTFAAPDKRFRSRGMIMPGPKKLENDSLENVKICIDTSGSISSQDTGRALAQIKQLLNVYKAKAELLYWDTRIRAIYPFEDIKDVLDKKPLGGGGTDANCIFEYFETDRDYKIGKKQKPSIIIVFTDGYFGTIDSKYKKYKDTIWVINQEVITFKAPFGKIAPFKTNE